MNVMTTGGGILLLLQLGMCAALCYSVLCRATKTNGDTRREVRWAMAFEGVTAGLLGAAPFLPLMLAADTSAIASYFGTTWPAGHTPAAMWTIFLLSILCVQLATAKYWVEGVPKQLQVGALPVTPPRMPRSGVVDAFMETSPMRTAVIALLGVVFLVAALGAPAPVTAAGASPEPDTERAEYVAKGKSARCTVDGGCALVSMEFMVDVRTDLQTAQQIVEHARVIVREAQREASIAKASCRRLDT